MANCTKCGTQLIDGVKFCTECGAAVSEVKAEAVPVTDVQKPQPQPAEQSTAQEQVQQTPPQPQQAYVPPQNATPQQAYAQPQPGYQQPAYAQPAPAYAQSAPACAQPQPEQAPGSDSPYGLISTWGYIGIMLLWCIPIIGFILMIIWACGGCRKMQKRNFSRAMLIVMAVSLIFSLILGFAIRGLVKTVVGSIQEEIGTSETTKEESNEVLEELLGGLLGGTDTGNSSQASDTSGLSGLLSGSLGEDLSDSLDEDLSGSLDEDLSGSLGGDLSGLLDEVEDINNEAAKNSNGWPSDLPDYPDGSMKEVENYRTEITGSSIESMWSYIETLKEKGYEFQDFYDFGMSEADMKSMNAWWGTNGKWYLSISFVDGIVTVDHTTELPDLSGLFG